MVSLFKIEINEESIQKLLQLREISDTWRLLRESINNDPAKENLVNSEYTEAIKKAGVEGVEKHLDLLDFDFRMVLYEIDNCFSLRRRDNTSEGVVCDGCDNSNRSYPCILKYPCYVETGFHDPNTLEWRISSNVQDLYPPKAESKIYNDQQNYIDGILGPNKGFAAARAMVVIQGMDFPPYYSPTNCIGMFLKIAEPRFELFWQKFTEIRSFGLTVQALVDEENAKRR